MFLDYCHGKYKKIIGIEADKKNFAKLEAFIHENKYKNVELINCGVWNEKTQLSFDAKGNAGSLVTNSSDEIINLEKLDDIVGYENISLIKMAIAGSEFKALCGAVNIIQYQKPALAVTIYYRLEDLIDIPQYINDICKDYKIYLRKHSRVGTAELVLYAIPK